MSGKRAADRQINNNMTEEELEGGSEEPVGTWQKADEAVLAQRKFYRARRPVRDNSANSASITSSNPFASVALVSAPATVPNPFASVALVAGAPAAAAGGSSVGAPAAPAAGNSDDIEAKLKALYGSAPSDALGFAAARTHMRSIGGAKTLRAHLESKGLLAEDGLHLKVGSPGKVAPFNVFACVASGHVVQPGMKEENAAIGGFGDRFVVACNRPENDANWASAAPEWVGKASMGQRHRFLTTRDLTWAWFNVLSVGLDGRESALREGLATLDAMHEAAQAFARGTPGWSDAPERLGLFFHCFPYNSVPSIHMHIVDLGATGPTFEDQRHKNLPFAAVRAVLADELAHAEASSGEADERRTEHVDLHENGGGGGVAGYTSMADMMGGSQSQV
eukprot:jgi/Chrpa1/27851/Chrysochromulina_OHIO_Genome00010323-RA